MQIWRRCWELSTCENTFLRGRKKPKKDVSHTNVPFFSGRYHRLLCHFNSSNSCTFFLNSYHGLLAVGVHFQSLVKPVSCRSVYTDLWQLCIIAIITRWKALSVYISQSDGSNGTTRHAVSVWRHNKTSHSISYSRSLLSWKIPGTTDSLWWNNVLFILLALQTGEINHLLRYYWPLPAVSHKKMVSYMHCNKSIMGQACSVKMNQYKYWPRSFFFFTCLWTRLCLPLQPCTQKRSVPISCYIALTLGQ